MDRMTWWMAIPVFIVLGWLGWWLYWRGWSKGFDLGYTAAMPEPQKSIYLEWLHGKGKR